MILFSFLYPATIWGVAQLAPNHGAGEVLVKSGKPVGFALVGQSFTRDRYFNGRPSAVGYNPAGSGGSNKAPSNPEYLQTVRARLDTFLLHNPGTTPSTIPVELITASGSGLDPHLSPQAAAVQIPRIAKARKLDEEKIRALVAEYTEHTYLGPSRIHVLRLNLALDEIR